MATTPTPIPPPPPNWAAQQAALPPGAAGRPAGFWIRFVAYMIDGLLLFVSFMLVFGIGVGIVLLLGASSGSTGEEVPVAIMVVMMLGFLVQFVIAWLYEALMTSSVHGATIGKMAVGVRIVKAVDGKGISFGRATGRFFLKAMVTPMVPFGIGYLIAAFTSGKRAVHDFMADTLVVKSS